MSCVQIRCLRWLSYSVDKDWDCECATARTLLCEVAFLAANDGFVLGFVFIPNSTNVEFSKEKSTWVVYRTKLVYFFSLNSLRKRVTHKWRPLNVSSISSVVSNFGEEDRLNRRFFKHGDRTTNVIKGHYK